MSSTTTEASEAALWARLLEPAESELSPEAARYILGLRFPESDVDRMRELADQARAGALSEPERVELDCYERVGHALSLMKSKARRVLDQSRAA
jgi:hypothetical protein